MRNGRPASRPITNPFATTPPSLVTRRRCSSPGPSQGAHMTSRSTLDLRTFDSAICAYSVGGVGENHRTGSEYIWEPYSPETLLARVQINFEGALEGYRRFVEEYFPLTCKLQPPSLHALPVP